MKIVNQKQYHIPGGIATIKDLEEDEEVVIPTPFPLFFFLNLIFIYFFIFGCVGSLLLHVGFL